MMKQVLQCTAILLLITIIGCRKKPTMPAGTPPPTVDISLETLKDDWKPEQLFVNEIKGDLDVIDLTDPATDTTHLDIRAFQHRYFDDETTLKPTWVVGYVRSETEFGKEKLPGPVLHATYGKASNVRYTNRLDETMRANPAYPMFKLGADSCRWYPIVYDVNNPLYVRMVRQMLYPKPRMENGVPVCRGLTATGLEMSSYYATTVHLHGANVSWRHDGYVNSSILGTGDRNTPPYSRTPISWGLFGPQPDEQHQFVSYTYPNTFPEGQFDESGQSADTLGQHGAILWYHDHAMMRTATNVYAGLAGAYIIEGKDEYKAIDDQSVYPSPTYNQKPRWWLSAWHWVSRQENHDIPLMIGDKSFTKNGFLFYNTTGAQHDADSADVTPEFLGNTIVVNGKAWPHLNVEPETYRFRVLNTSSTRVYKFGLRKKTGLKVDSLNNDQDKRVFVQIGTEGGLMSRFDTISAENPLTLAPGERADVLIDFSAFKQKDSLMLVNYAPNDVFGDDVSDTLTTITDSTLTHFVMAFVVQSDGSNDANALGNELEKLQKSAEYKNITANLGQLRLFDNEIVLTKRDSSQLFKLSLVEAAKLADFPLRYRDSIRNSPLVSYPMILMSEEDWNTEATNSDSSTIKRVRAGSEEIWAIWNATGDSHPIHIHLNRFRIIGRQNGESSGASAIKPAAPSEMGWKDVVLCRPQQTTYIRVKYLLNPDTTQQFPATESAQFVYHCHILEHEDASMMRRLVVQR
jgi:spore coat protein A, manganese oxidase